MDVHSGFFATIEKETIRTFPKNGGGQFEPNAVESIVTWLMRSGK
jgi:hypothetical protein